MQRNIGGVFEILFFSILAFVLHGLVPRGPLRTPIVITWSCVAFAGFHAHIFLHELGHLIVAFALRFKLRGLIVGVGPLLASGNLPNGMRIVWRLWPRIGFAQATDQGRGNPRIRQMLFIAGGPLSDIIFLVLGYWLIKRFWGGYSAALTHNAGSFVAATLLFVVFFTTLNGLVPQTLQLAHGIVRTDGWVLGKTLLAPRGVIGFAGDPSWWDALSQLQTSGRSSQFRDCEQLSFRAQQERLQSQLRPGHRSS